MFYVVVNGNTQLKWLPNEKNMLIFYKIHFKYCRVNLMKLLYAMSAQIFFFKVNLNTLKVRVLITLTFHYQLSFEMVILFKILIYMSCPLTLLPFHYPIILHCISNFIPMASSSRKVMMYYHPFWVSILNPTKVKFWCLCHLLYIICFQPHIL